MWTRRAVIGVLPAFAGAFRVRASENPIAIPARLNDFHQMYVPVRINGSAPLWCELDTGGGGPLIFIDAARAATIGVRPTAAGRSAGPGEGGLAADGRTTVTAQLPGLTLPDQGLVIQYKQLDKDGILGMSVFSRYIAELDYEQPALRLHDSREPSGSDGMEFVLEGNNPVVPATIFLPEDRRVEGRFVVDSGAGGSVLYLSRTFADRNPVLDRALHWVPDSVGLRAVRIERFSMGSWSVEKPVIRAFPARGFGGGTEPDGMIGTEFLRRFAVRVDYGRKRISLAPNRYYADPFLFDASGLRVQRSATVRDGFPIFLVVPETPAAEAGLHASDILLAVDGVPADRMSPGEAAEMLTRDGREAALLVQRGADVFTVRLKLRKLL